ncbi:MAG: hypothetical protein HZB85_05785 [Deltaproteobacteria bacterium]|nr:hypothetical protein [Deltaproteobacteria bacterium]
MSGKINIVFGFFYLALTAVLGPAFLVPQLVERGVVMKQAGQAVADVQTAVEAPQTQTGAVELAQKNAAAVPALWDALKAQQTNGKGAHAHGNLEALLNIVVGFILLSLAVPNAFKRLLTLLFILGAVFHSGVLYLGTVFGLGFVFKFVLIGEVSLIGGLVLMGVAAIMGIKRQGCC